MNSSHMKFPIPNLIHLTAVIHLPADSSHHVRMESHNNIQKPLLPFILDSTEASVTGLC